MTTVRAVRPCDNCGELHDGEWRWPLCDCSLCGRCAKGIVHACPACGAHRMFDQSRREGDWSGVLFVMALLVSALGLLLMAALTE